MNRKIFYLPVLLCGVVLALAPAGYAKNYHMTASNIVPGQWPSFRSLRRRVATSRLS